jgi:serine protease AprX
VNILLVVSLLVWSLASAASAGSTAGAARPPAPIDTFLQAALQRAEPVDSLDVVISLERVAPPALERRLAELGPWSFAFRHLPAAAVRIAVDRLDALRRLEGVRGVFLERRLRFELEDSARLNNTGRAWNELGVTGKGVTVAILDTGVDFTHPDLAPAMRASVKLVGFGSPLPVVPVEGVANSDTTSGHGTHVAGDAAGRGTASDGEFRGMAPGADLVGIGAGEAISIFSVLEGFDWILQHKDALDVRVVSNSWGTDFQPFNPVDPIQVATRALAEGGVTVLFAVGNASDEMTMNPYAAAPWVIPVAAGSKAAKITEFSSGGIEADTLSEPFGGADVRGDPRAPLRMGLYHPAVAATGEDVVSTRAKNTILPLLSARQDLKLRPDQIPFYTTLSGTSMATPEAAGIVALILEADPELTPSQVRSVLQVTARPIDGVPFYKQGYGYADASAAVELARSLRDRPPDETEKTLTERQAERDRAILAGLDHPSRTRTFEEPVPTGRADLTHMIEVPAGTTRLKIVANGPTTTPVGDPGPPWELSVSDANGRAVGGPEGVVSSSASGTVVLDLDLRHLDPDSQTAALRLAELAWGSWTVTLRKPLSLGSPASGSVPDNGSPPPTVALVAATFG